MSKPISEKRREYKRDWMRNWRHNNPDKALIQSRTWEIRKEARAAAAATGEPVEEVYARFGVPTTIHFLSKGQSQ